MGLLVRPHGDVQDDPLAHPPYALTKGAPFGAPLLLLGFGFGLTFGLGLLRRRRRLRLSVPMALTGTEHPTVGALVVVHTEFMNLLCFVLELVAALADVP